MIVFFPYSERVCGQSRVIPAEKLMVFIDNKEYIALQMCFLIKKTDKKSKK